MRGKYASIFAAFFCFPPYLFRSHYHQQARRTREESETVIFDFPSHSLAHTHTHSYALQPSQSTPTRVATHNLTRAHGLLFLLCYLHYLPALRTWSHTQNNSADVLRAAGSILLAWAGNTTAHYTTHCTLWFRFRLQSAFNISVECFSPGFMVCWAASLPANVIKDGFYFNL